MNVLFTSAGRRVELMKAFRAAYEKLGIQGNTVAVDIDPLAPALRAADKQYIVPRLSEPGYLAALLRICEKEKVSIVFPLIDPDIPVLSKHRAAFEAIGTKAAVPDPDGTAIAADKWRTYLFFDSLGISTPKSWLPHDPAVREQPLPLFMKPRQASASEHAYRIRSREHLAFFARYIPEPVVQELIDGPEITTDVVVGTNGTVLGMVSRRRIEVRSGEVMKGVTVRDDAVLDACERIAIALRARGPITVQCMLRDGVPYFTEINARFGGGLPLGIASGIDAPALVLAHARGDAPPTPAQRDYKVGLHITRFDDSFFVTEAELEKMARRRL